MKLYAGNGRGHETPLAGAPLQEDEAADQQQSDTSRHHPRWTGQPLQKTEEKLARWKRHFESVLNVHNTVAEEALAGLVDHPQMEKPEVTREEIEKAVGKLRNGKSAGNDRIVAELLKNGGEAMIDWLWELLQMVWWTKQESTEWKRATLVSLHRKKDKKACDNY